MYSKVSTTESSTFFAAFVSFISRSRAITSLDLAMQPGVFGKYETNHVEA